MERSAPAAKPKRRTARRPSTRRDGAPTASNPNFSLAQPGPAQIGVPNFFIEKFRIPPFLLRIYQAAGIEYDVPWQILAAINEIETDYGRNLNVSSAGAMGWMQFIPSSWRTYGVDANNDGRKDPYNPVDAIFAAARYLKAAGAKDNIRQAIFAYNHAGWYVDSVMLRAKLIGGLPEALVGAITGLTEGRFPVAARATYARGSRKGVNLFSRRGARVIAVNDGVIKAVGRTRRLGRYVVLQDVYGNRFTYSKLASVSATLPLPPPASRAPAGADARSRRRTIRAPPLPASAGTQERESRAPGRRTLRTIEVSKERLFAHPSRTASFSAGGDAQLARLGHRHLGRRAPARPPAQGRRAQAAASGSAGHRGHGARAHRQDRHRVSRRTSTSRSARRAARRRPSIPSRSSTAGSCSRPRRSTARPGRTRSSDPTRATPRSARSCS